MKVAEKIVFLLNDADGFGAAISDALNPNPSSPLRKLEEQIQLPLDKYGVEDAGTGGSIVHFIDENGVYQVSVFLLPCYEPPVLVCAMNELLDLITREAFTPPTIVATFLVATSKLKYNNKSLEASSRKASLHYIQVGPETETSRLFASRIEKPPPSMQIHYEPLSCLLHLARVKRLPTSILIGQRSRSLSHKALDEELQVIHETGGACGQMDRTVFLERQNQVERIKDIKRRRKSLACSLRLIFSGQVRSFSWPNTATVFGWTCTKLLYLFC